MLKDLVPLPAVWHRLQLVETRLLEVSASSEPFLTQIAQHLIQAGGKRFRPLVAQLAAEFGPTDDGRAVDAGAAVELIHLGSLYHDDVIDEAESRRGAESVNANWSNTIAILAGDYLLARASELAASRLGLESVELLATTYAELVEGQTLELHLTNDLSHSRDEYFKIVAGKTASLIRTSARLGALATDAERPAGEALSEWAWELGVVFQMTDDALDLVATDDYLGKPAGSDIQEGVFTLPVLYALEGANGERVRELLSDGKPFTAEAVSEVIDLVRDGGHVERVLADALERAERAERHIVNLPDSDAKVVLKSLGAYLLDRVEAARA
ncbi:MAG: polyprenyl synthetase family protein [Acidimicrobiia bacterium]